MSRRWTRAVLTFAVVPLATLLLVSLVVVVVDLVTVDRGASQREVRAAGAAPQAVGVAGRGETVDATVEMTTGGFGSTYSPATSTISQDGTLTVVNLDNVRHTLTSEAEGEDGLPLFDLNVPPGRTLTLQVDGLAAGSFPFYCRLHPNMRGTLRVVGDDGGTGGAEPTFRTPLVVPDTRRGDRITLEMRKARVQMLPRGRRTTAWTYGGTWPGPTIRRDAGDATRVRVVNRLPRKAGSMSTHLHGGHVASRFDGQPTSFLVRRGESRTYRYDLTESGEPVPGSFFWYHDHRMDQTTRNNWMGLQGMFVVDDPAHDRLGLPRGARDVPLMISDRSFTERNQLAALHLPDMVHGDGHGGGDGGSGMAFTGPHAPPHDITVGTRILVNGTLRPFLRTATARYRLRVVNSSAFSAYNLRLSNGRPLTQIGTGNGLLPHPVERESILLGPSQRADVVVDFRGLRGKDVVLETVERTDGGEGTGSRVGALMQFRVRDKVRDRSRVPQDLPTPELVEVPADPDEVAKTWDFSLEGDETDGTFWAINGLAYDDSRVDHRVELGSTQQWRLRNSSEMTHYVHLHQQQWRTVSRNGQAPPPWEQGLEDTWRLDPGEEVVVAAAFTDHLGPYMIHCHMLDHEDHGMMATFEVVPPTP